MNGIGAAILAGFFLVAAFCAHRSDRRWLVGVCFGGIVACAVWAVDRLAGAALKLDVRNMTAAERVVPLRRWLPHVDQYMTPPANYAAQCDGLEPRPFRIRTDANGCIYCPGERHQHPDATVIFLGGSTTECLFVEEPNRFTTATSRALAERHGLRVNCLNMSRHGNNTINSLQILLADAIPLQPDAVVLMHAVNDLVLLWHSGSYWAPSARCPQKTINVYAYHAPTATFAAKTLARWLAPNSCWLALRCLAPGAPVSDVDEWAAFRNVPHRYDPDAMYAEFAGNLSIFVAACRARNIQPVLMTQQNRLTTTPDTYLARNADVTHRRLGLDYRAFRELYDGFNATTRSIAAKLEVRLVDLDREIPHDAEHLHDVVHLTDAGSLLAADVIATELVDALGWVTAAKVLNEIETERKSKAKEITR